MKAHGRLQAGRFRYHSDPCPTCWRPPPVKVYLDDAKEVKGINRTFFCDDAPVNFSIGLMVWASFRSKFTDAIRACSAHSNYHVHWWHKLSLSETRIVEQYVLDDLDDVLRAHAHASANIFGRYEDWRTAWNARK